MKILHIIGGISRNSGGPARSSQGLVAALYRAGVDAWIYSFDGAEPWIDGVRRYVPFEGGQVRQLTPRDLTKFDTVHLHGLWDLRLHRVVRECVLHSIPYVLSPRGMLEPWSLKQKWLKKRFARWLYQDKDLRDATALHATAVSEAEQFRRLGLKNPVIISPNGINIPAKMPIITREATSPRRALFVSRMHPKKGVLELVESWARVRPQNWQCELVYTCNGDFERNYEQKVKLRIRELHLDDAFILTGALMDDDKWMAYARADLFVLPTYSENFGIVVAEALYAGLPVITTIGTPWEELKTCNCGWWIPPTVDALSDTLATATTSPELASMGARGHALAMEKYTWDNVCKTIIGGYTNFYK